MKKLFVHQPLFRLLSPFFSGVIVYLLILLLNNNVEQIQEEFFNEELYFCVGLCYLIQEFSRVLLLLFKRFSSNKISYLFIVLQVVVSMILCAVFTTVAIHFYFNYILGFSAISEEIYVFNSIFSAITLCYILVSISHQYLFKINTDKLQQEELIKQNIEDEFKQFKKGINPDLLFESLEALLVLIKKDKEKSDVFIDHLASIYRYILSRKEKQLVLISEELSVLNELIQLINYLPYNSVSIQNNCKNSFLVVPGSLLFIIEQIVKTSIVSDADLLELILSEKENKLEISYLKNDKITSVFNLEKIKEIVKTYRFYSAQNIVIIEAEFTRKISIPKLQLMPES
jgi:hypothetical protein